MDYPEDINDEGFCSDTEIIISQIQPHEFMYNKYKSQYRNKARKRRIFEQIAQTTKRYKTGEEVKKKWEYLRGQYATELRKHARQGNSYWKYFNTLSFLKEHVVPKKQGSPSFDASIYSMVRYNPSNHVNENGRETDEEMFDDPAPSRVKTEQEIENPSPWNISDELLQQIERSVNKTTNLDQQQNGTLSVNRGEQKVKENAVANPIPISSINSIAPSSIQPSHSFTPPTTNFPSVPQQNSLTLATQPSKQPMAQQNPDQQKINVNALTSLAQKINTYIPSTRTSAQLFGDYVGKVLDEMDPKNQKKLQVELMTLIAGFQPE